jgi:hypothetical protein
MPRRDDWATGRCLGDSAEFQNSVFINRGIHSGRKLRGGKRGSKLLGEEVSGAKCSPVVVPSSPHPECRPHGPGMLGAPPFHPVATERHQPPVPGSRPGRQKELEPRLIHRERTWCTVWCILANIHPWRSWHAQKPATRLNDTQPTLPCCGIERWRTVYVIYSMTIR